MKSALITIMLIILTVKAVPLLIAQNEKCFRKVTLKGIARILLKNKFMCQYLRKVRLKAT